MSIQRFGHDRPDRGDVGALQCLDDARFATDRNEPAHLRRAGKGDGIDTPVLDTREQFEHRGIVSRICITVRRDTDDRGPAAVEEFDQRQVRLAAV